MGRVGGSASTTSSCSTNATFYECFAATRRITTFREPIVGWMATPLMVGRLSRLSRARSSRMRRLVGSITATPDVHLEVPVPTRRSLSTSGPPDADRRVPQTSMSPRAGLGAGHLTLLGSSPRRMSPPATPRKFVLRAFSLPPLHHDAVFATHNFADRSYRRTHGPQLPPNLNELPRAISGRRPPMHSQMGTLVLEAPAPDREPAG